MITEKIETLLIEDSPVVSIIDALENYYKTTGELEIYLGAIAYNILKDKFKVKNGNNLYYDLTILSTDMIFPIKYTFRVYSHVVPELMPELNSDLFDDNFLIGYLKNELKKLDQEIFELNNKLNDKNKIYSNLKIELDKLEENLQKELLENNNFIS
jgi:hypothetical protein